MKLEKVKISMSIRNDCFSCQVGSNLSQSNGFQVIEY